MFVVKYIYADTHWTTKNQNMQMCHKFSGIHSMRFAIKLLMYSREVDHKHTMHVKLKQWKNKRCGVHYTVYTRILMPKVKIFWPILHWVWRRLPKAFDPWNYIFLKGIWSMIREKTEPCVFPGSLYFSFSIFQGPSLSA